MWLLSPFGFLHGQYGFLTGLKECKNVFSKIFDLLYEVILQTKWMQNTRNANFLQVVSAGDSSTIKLFKHLKNHYPAQYAEIKPAKVQKTAASSSTPTTTTSTDLPPNSPIVVALKNAIPYEHHTNK